jgi:hypothetical protein
VSEDPIGLAGAQNFYAYMNSGGPGALDRKPSAISDTLSGAPKAGSRILDRRICCGSRGSIMRPARLDAQETLHHVMVWGVERTALFRDDSDRATS